MKTLEQPSRHDYLQALTDQEELTRLIRVRAMAAQAVFDFAHIAKRADPSEDDDNAVRGYDMAELTPAA